MNQMEEKWDQKYGYAIKSWRENGEKYAVFLGFPMDIKKIIYTSNVILNLNGECRNTPKLDFLIYDEAILKVHIPSRYGGYKISHAIRD